MNTDAEQADSPQMSHGTLSLLRRGVRQPHRWPVVRRLPSVLTSTRGLRAFAASGPQRVLVLCVYRRRNAQVVLDLLSGFRDQELVGRLWALDEVAPELANMTFGVGPGTRCDLLNRLWNEDEGDPDWVVVTDDDARLVGRWTLPAFLGAMTLLDVDFAQPAHAWGSFRSHFFNVRRPILAGRRVAAVEIGPIIALRRTWVDSVLPFPDDAGMGYFLEHAWSRLSDQGCRAAVLDCVPMLHLGAVGAAYDAASMGSARHLEGFADIALDDLNRSSSVRGIIPWPFGTY